MKVQKACEIVDNPYYTAIKYADGRSECYGLIPVTNLSINSTVGSLYYATINSHAFPTGLFIDEPVVNATYLPDTDFTAFVFGVDRLTSSPRIYLARGNEATLNGNVALYAIGRWK